MLLGVKTDPEVPARTKGTVDSCWAPSCRETSSSPWARNAREGEIAPLTFEAWPSAVDKLRFMIRLKRYSQCEIGVRNRTALRGGVRARSRESIFREMRGQSL